MKRIKSLSEIINQDRDELLVPAKFQGKLNELDAKLIRPDEVSKLIVKNEIGNTFKVNHDKIFCEISESKKKYLDEYSNLLALIHNAFEIYFDPTIHQIIYEINDLYAFPHNINPQVFFMKTLKENYESFDKDKIYTLSEFYDTFFIDLIKKNLKKNFSPKILRNFITQPIALLAGSFPDAIIQSFLNRYNSSPEDIDVFLLNLEHEFIRDDENDNMFENVVYTQYRTDFKEKSVKVRNSEKTDIVFSNQVVNIINVVDRYYSNISFKDNLSRFEMYAQEVLDAFDFNNGKIGILFTPENGLKYYRIVIHEDYLEWLRSNQLESKMRNFNYGTVFRHERRMEKFHITLPEVKTRYIDFPKPAVSLPPFGNFINDGISEFKKNLSRKDERFYTDKYKNLRLLYIMSIYYEEIFNRIQKIQKYVDSKVPDKLKTKVNSYFEKLLRDLNLLKEDLGVSLRSSELLKKMDYLQDVKDETFFKLQKNSLVPKRKTIQDYMKKNNIDFIDYKKNPEKFYLLNTLLQTVDTVFNSGIELTEKIKAEFQGKNIDSELDDLFNNIESLKENETLKEFLFEGNFGIPSSAFRLSKLEEEFLRKGQKKILNYFNTIMKMNPDFNKYFVLDMLISEPYLLKLNSKDTYTFLNLIYYHSELYHAYNSAYKKEKYIDLIILFNSILENRIKKEFTELHKNEKLKFSRRESKEGIKTQLLKIPKFINDLLIKFNDIIVVGKAGHSTLVTARVDTMEDLMEKLIDPIIEKLVKEYKKNSEPLIPYEKIDYKYKNIDVYELHTSNELSRIGLIMKHCVGGYSTQVRNLSSFIFQIEDPNDRDLKYTVEFALNNFEKFKELKENNTIENDPNNIERFIHMIQIRGIQNSLVKPKHEKIIQEILKDLKEKIFFRVLNNFDLVKEKHTKSLMSFWEGF